MIRIFLFVFGVTIITGPVAAESQQSIEIQLASRQSVLAQRLVRALCFAQSNIDREHNTDILRETVATMDQVLFGLIDGNEAAGIQPIKNGNIQTQLSSITMVWKGVRKKVDPFLSGEEMTDKNVLKLTFKAGSLTKLWNNIYYTLETRASSNGDATDLENARMQKLAGSQSFFLQRAGKDACLIRLAGGHEAAERQVTALNEALTSFHSNAFALAFGDTANEISPPQNHALQTANLDNWQDWIAIEPLFDAATSPDAEANMLRELSYGIEFLDGVLERASSLYLSL